MRADRRKFLAAGLLFLLGFAVALGAGWRWFAPRGSGGASGPTLCEGDLDGFFRAVSRGDYAAVKDLGESLFRPGTRVAEAERLFAPYAVNSLPPYSVYALYTYNDPGLTRRVLLTLDGAERVESFLAEEMAVIR